MSTIFVLFSTRIEFLKYLFISCGVVRCVQTNSGFISLCTGMKPCLKMASGMELVVVCLVSTVQLLDWCSVKFVRKC